MAAITLAQEEERRRLARELHDDTTQTLIALTHRVEMCEKAMGDPTQLARRLNEVRELATGALESVRRVIQDLRPIYLEDMGLLSALEMLAGKVLNQPKEVRVTANPLARDGHFGLMGMRERALRFGGHLSLRSQPGEGTTVVVYLPYPPE